MEQVIFNCAECLTEISVEEKYIGTELICEECSSRLTVPEKHIEHSDPTIIKTIGKSIHLTTAPSLEGFKVTETLEIVTAECVFGMNVFKDILASFTDFFGGRSGSTQNVLREARKQCLSELRKEAKLVGADAVIAVDLDYSEFSGQGKSMLFLVASGTAVKVEKIIDQDIPMDLAAPL